MAFCPKCNGVMGAADAVCPHCGYDFPLTASDGGRSFAYSRLGNVALLAGMVGAGVGCVLVALATLGALLQGRWLFALLFGPLGFVVLFGLLVVFLRMQDR